MRVVGWWVGLGPLGVLAADGDKRRLKKSLVKCGCGASLGIFRE